jgi:hypothetical protein
VLVGICILNRNGDQAWWCSSIILGITRHWLTYWAWHWFGHPLRRGHCTDCTLRGWSDGMKRPRGWHPRDFEWGFCLVFHATQAFSLCCGCCTLMLWRADSRIAIPSRRGTAALQQRWKSGHMPPDRQIRPVKA